MRKIPGSKRERIYKKWIKWYGKLTCYYCKIECVKLKNTTSGQKVTNSRQSTIDHIIPLSKGGTHSLENLVIACRRCNGLKDNKIDFKKESNG